MDFGLSTIRGIKNPNIKDFKKDYGIFTESFFMYDAHLFLNSLYAEGILKEAIETLLPKEYLVNDSSSVRNYRLRADVNHEDALKDFTYKKILETLKPKAQNVLKSILNAKPKSPPKTKPKSKSPVNQNEAKRKAMAFLASKKKSPEKKKAPLKKPGLTKTKPKPLTIGSSAKKNSV
jgi:hypothetical protein